jgi:hypothetical protein
LGHEYEHLCDEFLQFPALGAKLAQALNPLFVVVHEVGVRAEEGEVLLQTRA